MNFIPTPIPEVIVIEPELYQDKRGFFMETYQLNLFKKAGIPYNFVQDNHSGSIQGTIRGLHYQIRHTQGKLVRAIKGEIFDVAVDLRADSPTLGKWFGVILNEENKKQLWIPPGFAHGFYVLSKWAEIIYKATDYYDPESERTLLWNDPDINIAWPLLENKTLHLSQKDRNGNTFKQTDLFD
jgi:dTDP-4-dehydrorhamnose 3,5-epimerase